MKRDVRVAGEEGADGPLRVLDVVDHVALGVARHVSARDFQVARQNDVVVFDRHSPHRDDVVSSADDLDVRQLVFDTDVSTSMVGVLVRREDVRCGDVLNFCNSGEDAKRICRIDEHCDLAQVRYAANSQHSSFTVTSVERGFKHMWWNGEGGQGHAMLIQRVEL